MSAKALRDICVGGKSQGRRRAVPDRAAKLAAQLGKGPVMTRSNVRARSAQAGALFAAVILCAAASAAAEVRVIDAGGGRLVIEAHDATVQQILDALGESRTIRFQASEALSQHVTGTYSGTLPRVLSRILVGYDHVIRSTSSGFQIDFVSTAQPTKFTASVANSVTMSASAGTLHGVSGNVDLDEENARARSVPGPQTVNVASAPHPSAPPINPSRAALLGNAQQSGVPPVSSNLDLDEETSR
jgi:hypothetical protein